jgi:hypothetical protein
MSQFFQRIAEKVVDWVTRERHIEWKFLVGGTLCITTAVGKGLAISLATKVFGHDVTLSALPSLPEVLQWLLIIVGAPLMACGAFLGTIRYFHHRSDNDRRRVFVIEQRGLRDTTDTPLINAIPGALVGRRESILIDIRERIKDGEVTHPEKALERVAGLPQHLERVRGGMAAADISTVYGGLSPVPFTFLAGLLLDDESRITIMDWDRKSEAWRQLDDADDGASFVISGIDSIEESTQEVAVAVSVSYGVDIASIQRVLPNTPLVELQLASRSTDGHWSDEKQRRLANEFLATVIRIADAGVRVVHLFVAAPNSVVFRLGRVYDKRNLPKLLVYQYQKGRDIEHPWSVEMPVHDQSKPQIRYSHSDQQATPTAATSGPPAIGESTAQGLDTVRSLSSGQF